MNGLLDLLEQKGVSIAYAFEFIRYAGKIDELIKEAKQSLAECMFVLREGRLLDW